MTESSISERKNKLIDKDFIYLHRSLQIESFNTKDDFGLYHAANRIQSEAQNKHNEKNSSRKSSKKEHRRYSIPDVSLSLEDNRCANNNESTLSKAHIDIFAKKSKHAKKGRNSLPPFPSNRPGFINKKSFQNQTCNTSLEDNGKTEQSQSENNAKHHCNDDEYKSYIDLFKNDKNFLICDDGWVTLTSEVERVSNL